VDASIVGAVPKPAYRGVVWSDLLRAGADLLVLWEAVAVGASGYGCARLYTMLTPAGLEPAHFDASAERISLLAGALALLVMRVDGAPWQRRLAPAAAVVKRSAKRIAYLAAVLLVLGFLTRSFPSVPRLWVLMWMPSALGAVVLGRLVAARPLQALLDRGMVADRIAVIGSGPVADGLVRRLAGPAGRGLHLVGVFDEPAAQGGPDAIAALIALGRQRMVDRVVLAVSGPAEPLLASIIARLKALDVEVVHCLARPGLTGALRLGSLAGVPILVLAARPIGRWGMLAKGMMDRVLATGAVLLLAPILVLIALAVRLDSPGPVIFRQRRHGWNGHEFQVFKFRTMAWCGEDAGDGAVQTTRQDQRLTRVGRVLRRTSLDELPQLFNVLNGTMSLVGPRPHPVAMRTEQRLGEDIIADYAHRHRVKPGITGWAQIHGHRGPTETAEQIRQRIEHDLYYIDNWSPLLDVWIILMTPATLLLQRGNAF
jgi:Undecaprenyl-phosphate glucose phosphotransferase